jgi:hypothetical protein
MVVCYERATDVDDRSSSQGRATAAILHGFRVTERPQHKLKQLTCDWNLMVQILDAVKSAIPDAALSSRCPAT